MRILHFLLPVVILFLFSCEKGEPRPDDALGTGRMFIRSLLDGNFKTANNLLYPDSSNRISLEKFEEQYEKRLSKAEKEAYRKSDIIIHQIENINDSVMIIYYSSSLQKQKKPLRILKKDHEWQIDFHYTYSGNL
ncbi:MAG: hypothetical protein ACK50E_05425 [Bacteroidota bacterium]